MLVTPVPVGVDGAPPGPASCRLPFCGGAGWGSIGLPTRHGRSVPTPVAHGGAGSRMKHSIRNPLCLSATVIGVAFSACSDRSGESQRAPSSRADSPPAQTTPAASTIASVNYDTIIGLAQARSSGEVCLAIPATLSPGTVVTLVSVPFAGGERAATAFPAQIASASARSCVDSTGVGVQEGGDSLYTLTLIRDTITPGPVYFAVAAPIDRFTVRGDSVHAQLGPRDEVLSFRVCTSGEGLHFEAWLGAPITGRRVWNRYYYLGYDVEPSCYSADDGGTQ